MRIGESEFQNESRETFGGKYNYIYSLAHVPCLQGTRAPAYITSNASAHKKNYLNFFVMRCEEKRVERVNYAYTAVSLFILVMHAQDHFKGLT